MTNEIKELIDNIKKIIEENRKNDFNHIILQSTSMEQLLDYITNLQRQLVYCLRVETGAGMRDCKRALEKCDYNYNTAYNYLRLASDGVARWKIVDGQRVKWTDEDYIKCARGDE